MRTILGFLLAVTVLQPPPPLWAEAPAGFDISLAKHLYVFPLGDRELEIQETWPPDGGSSANARSAVEFLFQYQVTLSNQLTATLYLYTIEISRHAPIKSGVSEVPFADHLPELIDGTYSALVEAKVWKKTGNHFTFFWEAATTGTVFVLVNAHRGFAIASPTAETSALADVTDLYPVGPDEPPRMAGVIIPPGAVTQPTLVWVDPVINDEVNWLVGQTGPLYSFGPETTFARPVTLVVPYDASFNEVDGVREVMNLMAHVGPNGALDPLLFTNIDIYTDTVTASTSHFSLFGIFRAISAVVAIFKPIIQVAVAVVRFFVSVIVQATQAGYNDMYAALIVPFREFNTFQPQTDACATSFDACVPSTQPKDQFHLLGSAAYLELLSANVPDHFLDQSSHDASRMERIRQLIHSGLVLISWEAANFGLNEGLNVEHSEEGPFSGPYKAKIYDPNGFLIGMRGWGAKNITIDGVTVDGWQTFSADTGGALIAIFETALATRQFVAEDSTPCLANAPIFQDYDSSNDNPCEPVLSPIPPSGVLYSGVKDLNFINPNRTDSDGEINDCLNKWVTNGKKSAGADTGCFSIVQNIEKLTYTQADALLTTFGKQVMDWWIRNASTEITSSDPNWGTFGHYFWYYVQGSYCVAKNDDGTCDYYYSDQSVIHNVNVLMGRAAFLLYRLTNETKYRDIAIRVQRVYKLAHFPCREEGTRYMSSCHAYGALKSSVRTKPSSPKSWAWAWKSIDGKEVRQTEDIEHAGSSAALNGLMAGESLFNHTNYGVSEPGQNLELTVNQRQYYNSSGCAYYNTFQCTNAHLGTDMRLEWWLDSNNNAFLDPIPVDTPFEGSNPNPKEAFAYPRETINGITNPNYNVDDPALWQSSSVRVAFKKQIGGGLSPYYFVEGANADAFETLYQWYTAYEKRSLDLRNSTDSIATGQTYKYMPAHLAWGAKKRAGYKAYVPDAHPSVASVSPSQIAIGGDVQLSGKYFSNSRFYLWVNGFPFEPEEWSNSLVRAEVSSFYRPGKHKLKLSVGGPSSSYFLLAPLYSNEVEVEVMAPFITSVSPARIRKGDIFTIYGSYFDDDAGDVRIDGVSAIVVTWMNTMIMAIAPMPATVGAAPHDGVVPLRVDVHGYAANTTIDLYEGPHIASIAPVAVGGRMTVQGDSFRTLDAEKSRLTVGGQIVPALFWSDTVIVADVPVELGLGAHNVQVADPRELQDSLSNIAVVETRAPALLGLFPIRVGVLAPLLISGQYFGLQPFGVTIGEQPAQINSWADTEIGVTVPDLPVGVYNVIAQVAGFPSNSRSLTVAPMIDGVTPSQLTGGDLMTITGALGAAPGRITIRGIELPIDSWLPEKAQAWVPANVVARETEVVVTVNNISTTFDVTIYPTLTSITPFSGTIDTEFTLIGSNFGSSARVYFAGERGEVEILSPSEVVISPPNDMIEAGPVLVRLSVNEVDSDTLSVFMIPKIKSAPSQGIVGSLITIVGYNFGGFGEPAPIVRMGAQTLPVVEWTAGSNRVVVSVPSSIAAGEQALTLEAAGFQSQPVTFRLLPKVESFAPDYGTPGSLITIRGSGFGSSQANMQVFFDNVLASTSNVVQDTDGTIVEFAAVIPTVNLGRHSLRLIINGIEVPIGSVEVMFPVSTDPAKVPVESGFKITGASFGTRLPTVEVDGARAHVVSYSDSEIVIGEFDQSTTPGEYQIFVETRDGDGLGSLIVVPKLDSLSPISARIGEEVVLVGAGFDAQSKVFFGNTEVSPLTWSYNTLRVKVPVSEVGSVPVHVLVGGLYDSRNLDFEVVSSSLLSTVSGGFGHTCVVADGGKVKCWGRNDLGQLGTGDRVSSASPREVIGLPAAVIDVTVALDSVCALTVDEEVWCWGDNGKRQLGNISPNGVSRTTPGQMALTGIKSIVAGFRSFCAVDSVRNVQCWGSNEYGQLGSYVTTTSWGLATVEGLPGPAASIAGGGGSFCAVVLDSVYCWGINNYRQAGGTASEFIVLPARKILGTAAGVVKVSGGQYHYCLLAGAGGIVQCWGWAAYGQLGDGLTPLTRAEAGNVTGISNIVDLSSHNADTHTCAVENTGGVYCWGSNSDGQSGQDPYAMPQVKIPLPVSGVSNVSALGTGLRHTCAIHSANTGLACWGSNTYQQLGVPIPPLSYVPIEIWLMSLL